MTSSWIAIAAMAENRAIGKDGKLPWHLPEELAWFKETTLNHTIVMGRKTYESIGRPLPKRTNIVISRTLEAGAIPGVHIFPSLAALKDRVFPGITFIIGGSELYKAALPLCDEIYLTHVKGHFEGDAFFPSFEHLFKEADSLKETPSFVVKRYIKNS